MVGWKGREGKGGERGGRIEGRKEEREEEKKKERKEEKRELRVRVTKMQKYKDADRETDG